MEAEISLAKLFPPHFSSLNSSNLLYPALLLLYFSKSDPEIQQMLLYSANSNTQ